MLCCCSLRQWVDQEELEREPSKCEGVCEFWGGDRTVVVEGDLVLVEKCFVYG